MKRNLLLILVWSSIAIFGNVFAQSPAIEWDKTIGGSADDNLSTIQISTDGKYILGGSSWSGLSGDKTEANKGFSRNDFWLVGLNINGVIDWDKTIGGGSTDILESFQLNAGGGYILGGSSSSGISGDKSEDLINPANNYEQDYWVVKLDENRNKIWDKDIGSVKPDYFTVLENTNDGGYILGGSTRGDISGNKTEDSKGRDDFWIVKLDSSGTIIWDNTIGGSALEKLQAIQVTAEGEYLLAGTSNSGISGNKTTANKGENDYWIVKLDAAGNILWDKTIGGDKNDELCVLETTNNGGFILGGVSISEISGDKSEQSRRYSIDYWVVKVDKDGNIEWDKTIGGENEDRLKAVCTDTDGGFILGGYSYSNISGDKSEATKGKGYSDYWIVKLNKNGEFEWDKTIGGDKEDRLIDLKNTSDGGYLLGGHSNSNISGNKSESCRGRYDYWAVKLKGPGSSVQISGVIKNEMNTPIPEVLVAFSNGGPTVKTNASGIYTATVPLAYTGTSTTTKYGYNFTPANYTFTSVDSDASNKDFTAIVNPNEIYGWQKIDPESIAELPNFSDVFFISDNEGWITTSSYAEIYHTTDSGETFEVQTTLYPCNAIYMLNKNEGYAGGTSGFIYRTTDGGENWIFHGTMVGPVTDISFPPTGETGFACGGGLFGVIYAITSSGITQMDEPIHAGYHSISFPLNSDEGWALPSKPIVHFSNGLWVADQDYPSGSYNAICMVDTLKGWIVGDGGIIAHTENGWNWVEQENLNTEPHTLLDAFFLTKNEGWVIGSGGTIIHTNNGGENWIVEGARITSNILTGVHFTSPINGYVVGNGKTLLKYSKISGEKNIDATLSTIQINSEELAGINAQTLDYNIELPGGTTTVPTIAATPTDGNGTVVITQTTTLPGTATILITAEDGVTQQTYTIHFTVVTGIEDIEQQASFNIYPNPAKEKFRVQSLKLGMLQLRSTI